MKTLSRLSLALGAGALSLAALAGPCFAADAPAPVQPYKVQHANPAGSYTIDPDHSSVQFSIGHAGISLVDGAFTKVSGGFSFDPRNPKADKADVTVQVDSLTTYLPARDKMLTGSAFLDAAQYPTMRFVGTRYVPHGPRGGVLHGELTLHGVTRPVSFRVRLIGAGDVPSLPKPWGGYLSGFVADGVIDRTQFGIDTYSAGIGHKVHVRVALESVRNPS
jgi:polyisoprenoid-binding protein YceI